jgi:hypothetical protein
MLVLVLVLVMQTVETASRRENQLSRLLCDASAASRHHLLPPCFPKSSSVLP